MRNALLSASALAATLAAPAAQSQTAPAAANAIEEIVVTAQRREESVQDVPVSITAFGAQAIRDMRVDDPAGLAQHVPNLSAASTLGGNAPIFALRGVSMNDYSPNQSSRGSPRSSGVGTSQRAHVNIQSLHAGAGQQRGDFRLEVHGAAQDEHPGRQHRGHPVRVCCDHAFGTQSLQHVGHSGEVADVVVNDGDHKDFPWLNR